MKRYVVGTITAILLFSAVFQACNTEDATGPFGQPSIATLYSSKITSVNIEVDYATGAEPYVGAIAGIDLWTLFKTNATRLLNAGNKSKALTFPSTLSGMQELTDVTGDSFTSDQIQLIAKKHRDIANTSSTASFYILFLPGYYSENGQQRTSILGISLRDTGIIAIFKHVIENNSIGPTGVLIEQSTLIHEFGHAIGLVNNGVPLTSNHEDSAHSAHCSNTDCIMNYRIEMAVYARTFMEQVTSGTSVLFDDACLADVDTFAAAQK